MASDLTVTSSGMSDDGGPGRKPSMIDAWFVKHARDLGRFLRRRLANEHDVEECVQETFLKVWRQEQRGVLEGEPVGYLYRTALNVARDRHRQDVARHQASHEALDEQRMEDDRPDAETEVHWRQTVRLLEAALADLRPSTRKVFLLHHVENLSYAQIAERLGVTTRTVEREMARALAHCASRIQPFAKGRP
jgi:RNA polymerase sigma factor (sigma-70 family)